MAFSMFRIRERQLPAGMQFSFKSPFLFKVRLSEVAIMIPQSAKALCGEQNLSRCACNQRIRQSAARQDRGKQRFALHRGFERGELNERCTAHIFVASSRRADSVLRAAESLNCRIN